VGNARTIAVPVIFLPTTFGTDEVKLNEAFLRRKVSELAPQADSAASPAPPEE